MRDVTGPRAAPLVAASLGDESLDPAVRDLALERLEALLLTAVRAVPGANSVERVTLSAVDGAVTLAPSPSLDDAGLAAVRERVDRTLLAQLAATVGAARLAVRNGQRALPRERAAAPEPEAPARWEDVVAALVGVVAAQQRAIDALVARTGAAPDGEVAAALRRVEAMAARLRAG